MSAKAIEHGRPPALDDLLYKVHLQCCPDYAKDEDSVCSCPMVRIVELAEEVEDDLCEIALMEWMWSKGESQLEFITGAIRKVAEVGGVVDPALAIEAETMDRYCEGYDDRTIPEAYGIAGNDMDAFAELMRQSDSHRALCRDSVLSWCSDVEEEHGDELGEHIDRLRASVGESPNATKDGHEPVSLPDSEPIVYVLEEINSERDIPIVKIGTTRLGWKRVASFDPKYPYELRPILAIPGGRDVESQLHRRFSRLRLRGEWFRFEGELKQFVQGEIERGKA